jgi:hypothetical protein
MRTKQVILTAVGALSALAFFLLASWIGLKMLIWALRLAGADL